MSEYTPLEGITAEMVETERLKMNVLTCGPEGGTPVVFLHGNFSSALYWEETMLALPGPSAGSGQGYRAIAPDLRGYGWTEDKLIDGTRGMGDLSDDVAALFGALSIDQAHLVGWSLGGGAIYRFLIDYPEKVLSVTLVSPVSPCGFGGTKDIEGTPCYDDFAGSGGGTVNPEFVKRIIDGDRSAEDPNSPRNVINTFYYVAPFRAAREEDFLTGALMEKMGTDRYPGDLVPSENWPNVAPGVWGPINAGSPKYVLKDVPALLAAQPKVPILWIRGSHDMIVSDNSMFDFGTLGKMQLVPGWPGDEIYPPQPMVSQTRYVLEQYAAEGGSFREEVIQDTAHSPHIEKPDEFNALFHEFLAKH
jgi:pimeloyl-ACP methyl ester carboxylesterase